MGNNNIGNYPYQSVYTLGQAQNYVFGGVYTQGAAVTTYVDPTLKWERTRTTDFGIETALFNNKLTFNASYFYRKTTDILYKPLVIPFAYFVVSQEYAVCLITVKHLHWIVDKQITTVTDHTVVLSNVPHTECQYFVVDNGEITIDMITKISKSVLMSYFKFPTFVFYLTGIYLRNTQTED